MTLFGMEGRTDAPEVLAAYAAAPETHRPVNVDRGEPARLECAGHVVAES